MISIIIPTFERPEKLKRCLSSVSAAVGGIEHEIIVVDDCANGSGFTVAKEYSARYFFKASKDRGLSSSRNIGIKLSRGEWLSFIDDDDFYEENGLKNLIDESSFSDTVVYGDYYLFGEHGVVHRDNSQMTIDDLLIRNRMAVGSYMVNKSKLKKIFDEEMNSHEDWDFIMPHMTKGSYRYVNTKTVYIDKTENETSSMRARRMQFFWMEFLGMYAKYPAPHLADKRIEMLATVGVRLPVEMLKNGNAI